MRRRTLYAAIAIGLAGTGIVAPRTSYASKTTSTLSPGDTNAIATARLLAGHGEPRLALAALRDAAPDAESNRLAVSLFAQLGNPASAESVLAAGQVAASDSERFKFCLIRARLLLDAGRYGAALASVAEIASITVSPYVAYRDYVAARAWIAAGDTERGVAMLEASRAHAPEALRAEIDRTRIDVYRALGRPQDALAAAGDAASSAVDAASKREVLRTRVGVAIELGDATRAVESARELFAAYRRSPEAEEAADALLSRVEPGALSAGDVLACATVLQARGRADRLRVALRRLDERPLTPAQTEEHRLLWAEYHYLSADYSRAIALARPSYADASLRRRSMLLMARSYRKVGRNLDAAGIYEGFAADFPNDGMAAEALYTAASIYGSASRERDQARVLDQLRHAYPSTFHGWAASMARAKALDTSGDHMDAAAIFEQLLTRSRRTDEAALFYLARQRRAAGDVAGADALMAELRGVNPYSFYSTLDLLPVSSAAPHAPGSGTGSWLTDVATRRGEAFERVRATVQASDAEGRPDASQAVTEALERGRFFLSVGLRDWAERELEVVRTRGDDSASEALALARLYEDHAMPWRSVRLYEKTRARIPWSERRERADDLRYLTHPIPYPAQVLEASSREQIAPYVLYGMMREESCFDADVVSRAGAIGLMQLMPETARAVAKKMDLSLNVDDRLGDPGVNVSIGAWYAADLLRAGKGSAAWMLAAYNAGPGAAGQWIRPGVHGDDSVDAVESVDYRETRGYVKRVVESANVYHALYFDGGGSGALAPR